MEKIFRSFDKVEFPDEVSCLAHEAKLTHKRLAGLSEEEILALMNRDNAGFDQELALVFEKFGRDLEKARLADKEAPRLRQRKAPPLSYDEEMLAALNDGFTLEQLRVMIDKQHGDITSAMDLLSAHQLLRQARAHLASTPIVDERPRTEAGGLIIQCAPPPLPKLEDGGEAVQDCDS